MLRSAVIRGWNKDSQLSDALCTCVCARRTDPLDPLAPILRGAQLWRWVRESIYLYILFFNFVRSGTHAAFACARACVSLTRARVRGWTSMRQCVHQTKKWLYVATEMGLCALCVRETETECYGPVSSHLLYERCMVFVGGKLKNISIIKADKGCLGDHVTYYWKST